MKLRTLLTTMISVMTMSVAIAEEMPKLHEIKTVTLERPYSDGGSYEKSALFITDYAKRRNSPDLLYNGFVSDRYIEASTAGDDFSLISDLGEVPLEKVTASKALNLNETVGRDNLFKEEMPIRINHTYVVLSSKDEIRSLVVYKVIELDDDGSITLQYAVKSYSIQESIHEARGFDWGKENIDNSQRDQVKELDEEEEVTLPTVIEQ